MVVRMVQRMKSKRGTCPPPKVLQISPPGARSFVPFCEDCSFSLLGVSYQAPLPSRLQLSSSRTSSNTPSTVSPRHNNADQLGEITLRICPCFFSLSQRLILDQSLGTKSVVVQGQEWKILSLCADCCARAGPSSCAVSKTQLKLCDCLSSQRLQKFSLLLLE